MAITFNALYKQEIAALQGKIVFLHIYIFTNIL
jgi:hypothetical protein